MSTFIVIASILAILSYTSVVWCISGTIWYNKGLEDGKETSRNR